MSRAALILAVVFFASCQPKAVLDEKKTFPEGQWTHADTLDFEMVMEDTVGKYDLFLDLEHSPEFANQNLYVKIYTRFPGGQRLGKLVSLELADKSGAWYGRCNKERCRLTIPIQERAFFDAPGSYLFTIEQFTRLDPLPGVSSVGMRILPSPKQN